MARWKANKKVKLTLSRPAALQQPHLVLTCVNVVAKNSSLVELPVELVVFVSELVEDVSKWSLETASAAGLAHLLPDLAEREWKEVGPMFRQLRFRFALTQMYERVHLKVLQWWLSSYLRPGEEMTEPDCWQIYKSAVENGRLDTLHWLQSQNVLPSVAGGSNMLHCAHSQVIYWLYEHGSEIFFHADLEKIAATGDFSFIQWAHAHRSWFVMSLSWYDVEFFAAFRGNFEMVQWMQVNRPSDFTVGALCGAVVGGHAEIARWAAFHSTVDDKAFLDMFRRCSKLVERVSIPMVQWLMSDYKWDSSKLRCDWIRQTLVLAARCGNLDAVKLLWSSKYCESHESSSIHFNSVCAMTQTASKGHLHVVKWLQPFLKCDIEAVYAAAKNGHFDIVQWFSSRYINDKTAIDGAVNNGRVDLIKSLCSDRYFLIRKQHVVQALVKGNLPMVQCLFDLTRDRFCGSAAIAAENGHFKILKWLHKEVGLSKSVIDVPKIVRNGHLNVLMYLDLHYVFEFTTDHAVLAARHRHFALLEWLIKRRPSIANAQIMDRLSNEFM